MNVVQVSQNSAYIPNTCCH